MTAGVPLLCAAAVTVAVDLADRSELRVRDSNEPVGAVIDLETTPSLGIRLAARALTLELGYSPRFTLRQIDHGGLPEALHHGLVGLRARLRRLEITGRAEGSWGTQSFTSLAPGSTSGMTTTPIGELAPTSSLAYASLRAGATLRFTATRRTTLSASFDYAASGGADAAARALVPFQRGPLATLDAEVAPTRRDRVGATVAFTRTTFSSGIDDILLETKLRFARRLSRRAEIEVAAGASALAAHGPSGARISPYPLVEVTIAQRFPAARVEGRLAARLGPVVSWLYGTVDERVQGDAFLTWAPRPRITVRAQLGAARSVGRGEEPALTLVLGEAAIGLQTSRAVKLELGTRGAWQKEGGTVAAPPQWVFFAGATFAAPTVRL